MTEADYGTFDRAFRRLSGAFRLKFKPGEYEELSRTYFRVLDAYPLDAVMLAGKQLLATVRTFPKAAEWLAVLTAHPATRIAADVRWMTTTEMDDVAYAAAHRYEDGPCGCVACDQAGVTDRPLRFVPTREGDTEARAFNSRRNVVELVGHWAHGDELARWYRAQAAFYALRHRGPRVRALIALVGTERDPGEEG